MNSPQMQLCWERCSWRGKRKKDEKSRGLCLKAERDHHHRFAVVCAVRRHIRYGATGKPETTLKTLELRGDGCESCINKKRISKQVYKIHIFCFLYFSHLSSFPASFSPLTSTVFLSLHPTTSRLISL